MVNGGSNTHLVHTICTSGPMDEPHPGLPTASDCPIVPLRLPMFPQLFLLDLNLSPSEDSSPNILTTLFLIITWGREPANGIFPFLDRPNLDAWFNLLFVLP